MVYASGLTSSSPPPSTSAAPALRLDRIARASVSLAALGPRLVDLASEMETQAQAQARRASDVAAMIAQLSADLRDAVKNLRTSAADVEDALANVARIAEFTRILSVNAAIEAARAGEHGRAFGVVVEEVQNLADRTGQTTGRIEERVRDMRASIVQVESVAGKTSVASTDNSRASPADAPREADAPCSVAAVNEQAGGMAESAAQQLEGVKMLNKLGDDVNALTESLLLGIGAFRFEAHRNAERHLAPLVAELSAVPPERRRVEAALARWLERHPHFELVYFTDANGRQIVGNIGWRGDSIIHDPSGLGHDWSQRPWFLHALRHGGVGSTDIYRSAATRDFCFTVSVATLDATGSITGVLGADVNFNKLLEL